MKARSLLVVLATLTAPALALSTGCGTDGRSPFDDDNNGSSGGQGDGGGASSSGEQSIIGKSSSSGGEEESCASESAVAERQPAYLYFLLDRSASMDNNQRWPPVTQALTAFLGAQESAGIYASLSLFPPVSGAACDEASYAPIVGLTALPDATPFTTALPSSPTGGNTPTLPALAGLLPIASAHQQANPLASTVVVLITDGSPNGCGSNITSTENIVSQYRDTVPTYVIGVGQVDNLNRIAEAGGTNQAIIVSVGDPEATRQQFLDEINAIRSNALSCDLAIPAPPSNQELDYDKINVTFTPSDGGAPQLLAYDQNCTSGGWRFDDPTQPQSISLCESTCSVAKADPEGQLSIEFGCSRRSNVQ